jgi:hypothetical protein
MRLRPRGSRRAGDLAPRPARAPIQDEHAAEQVLTRRRDATRTSRDELIGKLPDQLVRDDNCCLSPFPRGDEIPSGVGTSASQQGSNWFRDLVGEVV